MRNLIKQLKKGVKILGINCASFDRIKNQKAILFGVIVRGNGILEGVLKTEVIVDGEDATEKILEMVSASTHSMQLKMILTRGVTIAGFNYIDIRKISQETSLPVVSIVDHQPNQEDFNLAIRNVPNWEKRLEIINSTPIREVITNKEEAPVFIQSVGIEESTVDKFLKEITLFGRIPEPLRVARLIAMA